VKPIDLIKIVEEAFVEKEGGRVEVPPKPGIHPMKDAFIHAMPAYIPKMKAAGIKWVSGFPENYKHNLPYITGLIVLNDTETGLPVCVMDAAWITAKRTGAVTAMTAKYLAKENAESLGILGCGVQGRSNLESLDAVYNLDVVKAYDILKPNLERYVEEMKQKHELNVIPVETPREAVKGCDIVVTAGPILLDPEPVIEASWFDDGSLACPLDFDSYWKPEAMHSMHKFCTDDKEQLKFYQKVGYFKDIPQVYADLGEIVTEKKKGRENGDERIMAMNLGLAIEDMATAVTVYDQAKKKSIGTWLKL
jgi:ornithine cyclodeaminase/alanine dehydrogenase